MSNQSKKPFPATLFALDVVGLLLITLAYAESFGGVQIVPAALRFKNYVLALLVVGILLCLPYLLHVIKQKKADVQ